MTEQFLVKMVLRFLEPVGKRSVYTASRLAVLPDGTTVPVLFLLAKQKFGTWPEEQFPFWKDGDRTNEMLGNVELATRATRPKRGTQKNKFGVPAGSKEYMKRYREENRERVRDSQKRYTLKRRAVVKHVLAADAAAAEQGSDEPAVLSKLQKAVEGEAE
jgi:hypothetical protein